MNNFHDPDHWRFQHEYAEGHSNDSPVDLSGREGAPRESEDECPACASEPFSGIEHDELCKAAYIAATQRGIK